MTAKQVLKECRVFEALSDADRDRIVAVSRYKEYEAGATVFSEKSPAGELYVLEKGKVALQMQLPVPQPQLSRRVTVDVVTRNEIFGWSALVEPHQYKLTAVCLEPTRVLAIDGTKLRALLQENQRIGYEVLSRLINVVASRLDETRQVLISERLVTTAT